jgi:hypothetical protein
MLMPRSRHEMSDFSILGIESYDKISRWLQMKNLLKMPFRYMLSVAFLFCDPTCFSYKSYHQNSYFHVTLEEGQNRYNVQRLVSVEDLAMYFTLKSSGSTS